MEWQQLKYFQKVASLQHMTRAAEELKISQPALSRAISRLEKELEVPLFDRQGRSIILNRYGQRFLTHVNCILHEYKIARHEIKDLVDPERGEIQLGFLHTLGASYIPDLIKGFCNNFPNIKFKLYQNSTRKLIKQLVKGELDLCMSSCTESNSSLEWVQLYSEELFVIVPSDHYLADFKMITLKEIADQPLISFKKGYGVRKTTDDLFKKVGINPRITFEGEEVHTIIGLVAAGLGVSLIPDTKEINQAKVSLLRVKSPKCVRDIGLARIKGHYLSPALNRFWQFVLDYFECENFL